MLEIYVDADACPVKGEILRVAGRHGLKTWMVSDGGVRPSASPLVELVIVPSGMDAADDWIAERIGAGDIALTADTPLAARCIAKGARVLRFNGRPFDPQSIGGALATRDLMAHLRETGEITGGPPPFTKQDRSRFLDALETAIQAAKRERR
ncbi:MAG: YaiI/YqxD family protein [Alphaproteobacteria bacterium]|nr:YaiI/YqxD family protein [Alphaproteobacteria bacterium]